MLVPVTQGAPGIGLIILAMVTALRQFLLGSVMLEIFLQLAKYPPHIPDWISHHDA